MNTVALQFISRPFVVGDRIEISSVGGAKFVVGTVERVDPMRTIIRTDACMPITIPNKVYCPRQKKCTTIWTDPCMPHRMPNKVYCAV